MPRIRRWFHVSHDINSDPEIWELTDRFGERAFRVWLQILSIADTHNGVLKGTLETWSKTLLRLYSKGNPRWLRRDSERLLTALRWMSERGWITVREGSEPSLEIVNYWKYNPRRDTKEYPQREQTSSPPVLSSLSLNGFNSLWSLHPGPKGSKKDALKEYKLISPPESAVQAMDAQVAYKRECDRRSIFCAPIPHLHRWIKKMRWEDEIPTIPLTQTERLWREGQAEEEAGAE